MNAGQLQQVLRAAGWPEDKLVIMAAIGLGESSGNPNALNHTSREYSVGLWQINLNAHPEYRESALRDPVANARAAFAIYQRQGLRAWGAYTDGRYRQYLSQSQAAYSGGSSYTQTSDFADYSNEDLSKPGSATVAAVAISLVAVVLVWALVSD